MRRGEESVEIGGRTILAVDDGNAYLEAGVAGLGVLWLLDYMAKGHVTRGELVRLFDDWQMAPMPLTLAYAPNRHVSARLRVFIDWVGEVMAHV
jgi:DNA-binding transcriptional LysR family regulator